MSDKMTAVLWIPDTAAPFRERQDPQPNGIDMPAAPIGVNLFEEPPAADCQILWRALKQNDRHTRAVTCTKFARTKPDYRELISFRIEYEIAGKTHTLPRPLPKEPLPGEPPTGRRWQVDAINVVATLEPAAAPSATEEITLDVDVAFVDPQGDEPTSRPLLMSRQAPEIAVEDLGMLMSRGFFETRDENDYGSDSGYAAYRTECHETAANLLRPRPEALELTAERRVRTELENRLRNGEHLTIDVRRHEDRLTVTARAGA